MSSKKASAGAGTGATNNNESVGSVTSYTKAKKAPSTREYRAVLSRADLIPGNDYFIKTFTGLTPGALPPTTPIDEGKESEFAYHLIFTGVVIKDVNSWGGKNCFLCFDSFSEEQQAFVRLLIANKESGIAMTLQREVKSGPNKGKWKEVKEPVVPIDDNITGGYEFFCKANQYKFERGELTDLTTTKGGKRHWIIYNPVPVDKFSVRVTAANSALAINAGLRKHVGISLGLGGGLSTVDETAGVAGEAVLGGKLTKTLQHLLTNILSGAEVNGRKFSTLIASAGITLATPLEVLIVGPKPGTFYGPSAFIEVVEMAKAGKVPHSVEVERMAYGLQLGLQLFSGVRFAHVSKTSIQVWTGDTIRTLLTAASIYVLSNIGHYDEPLLIQMIQVTHGAILKELFYIGCFLRDPILIGLIMRIIQENITPPVEGPIVGLSEEVGNDLIVNQGLNTHVQVFQTTKRSTGESFQTRVLPLEALFQPVSEFSANIPQTFTNILPILREILKGFKSPDSDEIIPAIAVTTPLIERIKSFKYDIAHSLNGIIDEAVALLEADIHRFLPGGAAVNALSANFVALRSATVGAEGVAEAEAEPEPEAVNATANALGGLSLANKAPRSRKRANRKLRRSYITRRKN